MPNSAAPLSTIFAITDRLVPLILDGLSDADARARARDAEGPSIAWHLGHLLSSRYQMLQLLHQTDDNPYEASFARTPATEGDGYPTTVELAEEWSRVSARLGSALASATEADLDRKVGGGFRGDESVREKLAFLAFHEGYHTGSIAALQKTLGRMTPPEKIIAAMEAGG